MTLSVAPSDDDVFTKLGTFVETVVSAGVPTVRLPINRVAMPPASPGFVGMRIVSRRRLMTNLDEWDRDSVEPVEISIMQAMELLVQLDCYGRGSGAWAVALSTVLRDEYGVTALSPILSPLHADDPKFAPLVDGEEQYEQRWIVEARIQYNPVVSTPMQFANAAEASLINVDERYPP